MTPRILEKLPEEVELELRMTHDGEMYKMIQNVYLDPGVHSFLAVSDPNNLLLTIPYGGRKFLPLVLTGNGTSLILKALYADHRQFELLATAAFTIKDLPELVNGVYMFEARPNASRTNGANFALRAGKD